MPTFELCVLGSPSLHGVSYGRRTGVAAALSEQLPELGAAAMRQVAIDDLETDSGSWPVFGRFLEPTFSRGVQPLTFIMNLNTTYGGFDFGAQRVALHAAFRQHLWVAMCQVARETLIDLASVRSSRPYGRFPFTVRVVCGAAVGSDVTESGEIVGEFGGSTGLTRLSAG